MSWTDWAAEQLYWNGLVRLPYGWAPEKVKAFRDHLKGVNHYPGHVMGQGSKIPYSYGEAQKLETSSHRMADVVRAPHFLDFALGFTDLAQAYLGKPPRLYSVNCFWTRPGTAPIDPNIQDWHRDRDDKKFLVLFMYGTPILEEADGPHRYVCGSHRQKDGSHRAPEKGEQVSTIYGDAGSFFFADGSGLHMGDKPVRGERLLAWARWGVSAKPQSYEWDKLEPVLLDRPAPSERIKKSTELVVQWA